MMGLGVQAALIAAGFLIDARLGIMLAFWFGAWTLNAGLAELRAPWVRVWLSRKRSRARLLRQPPFAIC